jgi:hypothetical protein
MRADNVRRSAERTFSLYAVYGISVEGVIDGSVLMPVGTVNGSSATARFACPRSGDARPDLDVIPGRHAVVGDEDADPKVARIVAVDVDGNIELKVLPGNVESHLGQLAPT